MSEKNDASTIATSSDGVGHGADDHEHSRRIAARLAAAATLRRQPRRSSLPRAVVRRGVGVAAAAGAPAIFQTPGRRPHRRSTPAKCCETRMSGAGWCLAQLARLIGGPLPIVARSQHAERRHRDRGHGDRRSNLDAAIRPAPRFSADHPFLQALRRSDRHRGISRPWLRHGAPHRRARRHAGVSQRPLFPANLRSASAPAALGSRRAR